MKSAGELIQGHWKLNTALFIVTHRYSCWYTRSALCTQDSIQV